MADSTTKPRLEKPCKLSSRAPNSLYPRIRHNGKGINEGKAVLEKKLGRPLLPGMIARHLCFVKRCIEESHLMESTYSENHLDDDVKCTGTKTHFVCGHARIKENERKDRSCRLCANEGVRRWRRQQRTQRKAMKRTKGER